MVNKLLDFFQVYPQNKAPFLHRQYAEWKKSKPLKDLTVLHNVPLVPNTLLKIACLVAAGAKVTVTNPYFLKAHPIAVNTLLNENIPYIENIAELKGKNYDIYFDCCGELHQKLGAPQIGSVELTASGDTYYQQQSLTFPVISIDKTYTKQLETVLGSAESVNQAITHLTHCDVTKKRWLVFGFGKIGRGIAFFCVRNKIPVTVIDLSREARNAVRSFNIDAIDSQDNLQVQNALAKTDIVVTATGSPDILNSYPKKWFKNKILANMGACDEYGSQFTEDEILNNKLPVNFALEDPTPIQYIDPELYAHNIAVLEILNNSLNNGLNVLSKITDKAIMENWCHFHNLKLAEVTEWFLKIY